jgi:hypothetical protein
MLLVVVNLFVIQDERGCARLFGQIFHLELGWIDRLPVHTGEGKGRVY